MSPSAKVHNAAGEGSLKLEAAIANNAGLYAAVFHASGKSWRSSSTMDYCTEKAPPLYSNIITRAPDWCPECVFHALDDRARRESWTGWSIKDSYDKLQLTQHGFEALFQADWLYLDASARPISSGEIEFARVTSIEALAAWSIAWDPDVTIGAQIFLPALLTNPDFHIFAGLRDGVIECGFIANRTGAVVGLSNYFGRTSHWPDVVAYCRSVFATDFAGYERDPAAIELLRTVGFEIVGKLTVWFKPG
jgi:hypothetical protein